MVTIDLCKKIYYNSVDFIKIDALAVHKWYADTDCIVLREAHSQQIIMTRILTACYYDRRLGDILLRYTIFKNYAHWGHIIKILALTA